MSAFRKRALYVLSWKSQSSTEDRNKALKNVSDVKKMVGGSLGSYHSFEERLSEYLGYIQGPQELQNLAVRKLEGFQVISAVQQRDVYLIVIYIYFNGF